MKIGIVFPQVEMAGDRTAALAIAAAVDDGGFTHLLAFDHVIGAQHADRKPPLAGPYDETSPFHDPLVLFAYLAGQYETLEFASGVVILPQRQTVLVARQAADLAILSGGRFRLGVGIGWNHVEYRALGVDFSTRGTRMDEQLRLLRLLWTEPLVAFHGRFDTVDRAALVPRPPSPVPLWTGGASRRALRRAARLADGHIFIGGESLLAHWEALRGELAAAGRDASGFGAEAILRGPVVPSDGASDGVFDGLFDGLRRDLDRWEQAGGTHGSVSITGLGLGSVQAYVEYVGRLADALAR